MWQDVERNWALYPAELTGKKGGIEWADYINYVYEPLKQQSPGGVLPEEYLKLQKRDRRRLRVATGGVEQGRLEGDEGGTTRTWARTGS